MATNEYPFKLILNNPPLQIDWVWERQVIPDIQKINKMNLINHFQLNGLCGGQRAADGNSFLYHKHNT